jgi:hypothetical protein
MVVTAWSIATVASVTVAQNATRLCDGESGKTPIAAISRVIEAESQIAAAKGVIGGE